MPRTPLPLELLEKKIGSSGGVVLDIGGLPIKVQSKIREERLKPYSVKLAMNPNLHRRTKWKSKLAIEPLA
jgi:hypothetical protein